MLHARHHFLADEAALFEIDAVQGIHGRLVRERVAVDEVLAALGHAERDALLLPNIGIDRREALERRFRALARQDHARAQARDGAGRGIASPRSSGGIPSSTTATARSGRGSIETFARSL